MHIKERITALFTPNKTDDTSGEYTGVIRRRRVAGWPIILIVCLVFLLLFLLYHRHPNGLILSAYFNRPPKPISQSKLVLPKTVQQAIRDLAQQELKQEQAMSTLTIDTPGSTLSEPAVTDGTGQRVGNADNDLLIGQAEFDAVHELITTNHATKATLRLKKIDRKIAQLQQLLATDKSDKALQQAVSLIKTIGAETVKVATDKAVQTNRDILARQIEQYNSLQLILQRIEDQLPMSAYLQIEDARKKYLVATAVASINAAPNLDAVHAIAVKEVAKMVGADYAELKAIEITTDFENEVKPEAKQKLHNLQRQLANDFEKKMLKLPQDVRNRKLQSYIHYSFGDPILQIQSLEHMKSVLNDREIIMAVDSLKEVALKRLANRIFELDNQADLDRYVDRVMQKPADIKVLGEMQLAVNSGRDQDRIKKLAQMEKSTQGRIARFFTTAIPDQLTSFFTPEDDGPTDLMDVLMVSNLSVMITNSADVSAQLKQQFRQASQRTLERFMQEIAKKDFVSQERLSYNPVSANADVRLLLSNPQSIVILQNLRNQVPASQRNSIDRAIAAATTIAQEHLLLQVNDPEIFNDYAQFITNNSQVKQAFERYAGRQFQTNVTKKSHLVERVAAEEKQQLYEVIQQISQAIFLDAGTTPEEKQLPPIIRKEIQALKRTLPARNIPKLTVPEGVHLPSIATLPNDVEHAIIQAAKARIRENQKSNDVKLDLTLTAKDFGVAEPRVLPGSVFYPFKRFIRRTQLLLTFDGIKRAQLLIKHNNERTLEAAKLLRVSDSRENVSLALETLAAIEKDFNLLKKNASKLDSLKQKDPKAVDQLIDAIIKNGLARQTVFAAIEDKVYGADYVKVEKIRQRVLRDGVATLLSLSNDNAQVLVEKLEQAVTRGTGGQFKELKAIELLTEIKRFEPEKIDQVLAVSTIRLVKKFETQLLAIEKTERDKALLAYAASLPGNPIRQFEAYEQLKDNFTKKDTLLLVQGLETKVAQNLTDIVSGITDQATLQAFAQDVVGGKPEDLAIVLQVELQVATPSVLGVEQTPIEQKIADIKTIVEQQIIEVIGNDPTSVAVSDLFSSVSNQSTTSVADVEVVKELAQIIEQSPLASPAVVETIKELEKQVVTDFIETVTTNPTQALEPAPQVIETLIELKQETPPLVDAQIDKAIQVEVGIIGENLTTVATSPEIAETYLSQITDNPEVSAVITTVGGSGLIQELAQTAATVSQTTTQEQTLLQETITQLQEEIFSSPANNPASVETSLPEPIQATITEIKNEIPAEQVPTITATSDVTVTVEAVQTSSQTVIQVETAPQVSTSTQTTPVVVETTPTSTIPQALPAPGL